MSEDLNKILEKLENMEKKINILETQTQKIIEAIRFAREEQGKAKSGS